MLRYANWRVMITSSRYMLKNVEKINRPRKKYMIYKQVMDLIWLDSWSKRGFDVLKAKQTTCLYEYQL